MRRLYLTVFGLILVFSHYALADEALSPKATLCSWSQNAASWSMDQVLKTYQAQGEKETKFAHALAEQASSEAKLQKAIRDKWGKEAELAVARAVSADTLDDDQAATEKIEGDHAMLSFSDDAHLEKLYLVKVDGEWKLDVAAYVKEIGEQLDTAEKFLDQSVKLLKSTMLDLDAGKYKESAEVVSYLKTEFEKITPAP